MKSIYIISIITLIGVTIIWNTPHLNTLNMGGAGVEPSKTISELQHIGVRISLLSEQFAQANESLVKILETTQKWYGDTRPEDSYTVNTERYIRGSSEQYQDLIPDKRSEEAMQSKVLMVDPTPAQQQSFEELKARLDDLNYLSNLNLQEFASMPEVQILPKSLKMVLIGKAIEQYNRGNINRDTFLKSSQD